MFKRLGRRFYSAKYVFSVHLHSVSPWFAHDKPVKVVWKRGTKKHKRGETASKMPTRFDGDDVNAGALNIEEGFELGVTLYAESNRTKKTGPYGKKDLKLVIMEVDEDGSLFSILGALNINLNEYVGGLDHRIKLPVQCDHEIVNVVGQPYIDITVRSWYKQGGTASASSGLSSSGWSVGDGSDAEEDEDITITMGDAHLDPIKPIDPLDSRKSIGAVPIDSVHDHAVQADVTAGPATVQTQQAPPPKATEKVIIAPAIGNEPQMTPSTDEKDVKHKVHDDALIEDEEATDLPSITMNQFPETVDPLPKAEDLITVGKRYSRLSTINSEAGEDVTEFMDSSEDALKEFIKNEMGDDEMEGIPEIILAEQLLDKESKQIEDPVASETQEVETHTAQETSVSSSENQEPDVVENEVKETPPSLPEPQTACLPVSTPSTETAPATESIAPVTSKSNSAKPVGVPVAQKRPQTKPRIQSRSGLFWWLPGSHLVCCQPVLPREP